MNREELTGRLRLGLDTILDNYQSLKSITNKNIDGFEQKMETLGRNAFKDWNFICDVFRPKGEYKRNKLLLYDRGETSFSFEDKKGICNSLAKTITELQTELNEIEAINKPSDFNFKVKEYGNHLHAIHKYINIIYGAEIESTRSSIYEF